MNARYFVATIGMIGSIGLMELSMWSWGRAGWLSAELTRPDVGRWAVRSAAIAACAAAQLMLLMTVGGARSQRSLPGAMLKLSAGAVAGVAMVSAVALGLAGR